VELKIWWENFYCNWANTICGKCLRSEWWGKCFWTWERWCKTGQVTIIEWGALQFVILNREHWQETSLGKEIWSEILVGKHQGKNAHSRHNHILKVIFKKSVVEKWTWLYWLELGPFSCYCKHGVEPLQYVQVKTEFLHNVVFRVDFYLEIGGNVFLWNTGNQLPDYNVVAKNITIWIFTTVKLWILIQGTFGWAK
jgi:hypothetical protein